ncbi:protein of unknown function (plasmid) [Pararobbsia alpina]|uniref:hypothetical protein n=1 Tax=Pararobbsia alpina TaxID=621374 RepID=UPI0039A68109
MLEIDRYEDGVSLEFDELLVVLTPVIDEGPDITVRISVSAGPKRTGLPEWKHFSLEHGPTSFAFKDIVISATHLECQRAREGLPALVDVIRLGLEPNMSDSLRVWVLLVDQVARAAYAVMESMKAKFPSYVPTADDSADVTEAAANCLLDRWSPRDALTPCELVNGEWVPRDQAWFVALRGSDIQALLASAAAQLQTPVELPSANRLMH